MTAWQALRVADAHLVDKLSKRTIFMKQKVSVLGAGAWGTALAALLVRNGHDVLLWAFEDEVAKEITCDSTNSCYLSGCKLPDDLRSSSSLEEVCAHSRTLILACPVAFIRSVLGQAKPFITPEHGWVTVSKGLEAGTLEFPLAIIDQVFGTTSKKGVLGGPNFARDVACGMFSSTVIASQDQGFLDHLYVLFHSPTFHVTKSADIVDVQVAGTIKNVIAVAIGIARGCESISENSTAFLFTQGLNEMKTIAQALGGGGSALYGPAGVGDLVLTAMGSQSRNVKAGMMFASGSSLDDVKKAFPALPEGLNSLPSVLALAEKLNITLPLCNALGKIIDQKESPKALVSSTLQGLSS